MEEWLKHKGKWKKVMKKKKNKKIEENDPTLHPLPITSIPLEVKHEEEEVSFEDFDIISVHQCNDEILNAEYVDFVFGDRFDEHVASNSSKNCKFSFIHMHVNILACELNVGDLSWIVKNKKNKLFLLT